jgi:hypothetical protein
VWWRLRKCAAWTLFCCEGLVKACISSPSASWIVHHGGWKVPCRGPVASAGCGVVGVLVYITEWEGWGAMAPTSTQRVCPGGNVSKVVTASFAASSTNSLPFMLVWVRSLWRVVENPV